MENSLDLYYRIEVMTRNLPPLRERSDDVRLLATHFAGDDWQIAPDALQAIQDYSWPGNVRQLINALERAKMLADDEVVTLGNLPQVVVDYANDATAETATADADIGQLQNAHIREVLQRENGNKARTACALGVSRRTLYRWLEKFEID